MAKVTPGTFWIRTHHPTEMSVKCLLGPDPVRVTDGYAKWTVVDRKKRRGITEWVGTNPLTVEVGFLIDYFDDPDDNPGLRCQRDIRDLEEMAGLNFDGDVKPPECLWDANAPHDNAEAAHLRWIVFKLEWGDSMFNKEGNKVRQGGTITLMQSVTDAFITATGAAKNRKKTGQNKPKKKKLYTVKKSDSTLKEIAQNELGNANLWTKIAKLNGLRSPNRTKNWPKKLKMP